MSLYYVKTPIVTMRKHPKKESEALSEALCSERVHLLKEEKDWALIATAVDSYQGWVPLNSLVLREKPFESSVTVNRCAAHLYDQEDTIYGPILTLPFDCQLEVLSTSNSRWLEVALVDGQKGYIQRGDVTFSKALKSRNELKAFSFQFLNLPYTWGGRSSFGYDCSGFVQMLYRHMGLYLPRDAKDQVTWEGFTLSSHLAVGDLLFWGASETSIHHVGMYLENERFIHATVAENAPYIRVSYLSDPEWNGNGRWPYKTTRSLPS